MGVLLRALGWAVVGASMVVALWLLKGGDGGSFDLAKHGPALAGLSATGCAGSWLVRLGRRLGTPSAEQAMARDPRPPVLYLRSFQADHSIGAEQNVSRQVARVNLGVDLPVRTFEEHLCEALQDLGPVVAVGRPGEWLPPAGAARMYLEDDAWQDRVRALKSQAGLVVFVVGNTPGFWWEVNEALKSVPRERILFVFPRIATADRESLYAAFRRKMKAFLAPNRLPPELGPTFALHFERDGTPALLPWDPDAAARESGFRPFPLLGTGQPPESIRIRGVLVPVARQLNQEFRLVTPAMVCFKYSWVAVVAILLLLALFAVASS